MRNSINVIGFVYRLIRRNVVAGVGGLLEKFTKNRRLNLLPMALIGGFLFVQDANAYTTVLISTVAPIGLEKLFLANTTNYLNGSIYVNPFAANTYQITLYGLNPNYVPPTNVSIDTTTWFSTLNTMVTNSSYTYVWGWGDGVSKERFTDLQYMSNFTVACVNSSTSTFLVVGTSSTYDTHISSKTCLEAVTTIQNFINQQNFPATTTGYWEY